VNETTPPADGLQVAVRVLCAFTAQAGDLDLRFTPSPTAQDGVAGHETVTARRAAPYQREVPLRSHFGDLLVQGRADGFDPGVPRLEEIKTHRGDVALVRENHRALHWAQARMYAWMLCEQLALQRIEVALVYFNIDTQLETALSTWHTADELRQHFNGLCSRYLGWARSEEAHRRARDAQLQTLAFPFDGFRAGQHDLAGATWRTHHHGRHLLVQAPTGIGKTMATLFGALKAMPKPGTDKLLYLTAKTPGRQLALDALARLQPAASVGRLRVLERVAREKACEHPDKACHGDACPLASGFYDRLPQARSEAAHTAWLDQAGLRTVALKHGVCPYYLGQDMLRWSDVVVGDFNHFFDLSAHAWALTVGEPWRVGLLVDEAHNLVERARLMYSAELDPLGLAALRKAPPAGLKASLDRLHRFWGTLARDQAPVQVLQDDLPDGLVSALQQHTADLAEHRCAGAGLAVRGAALRARGRGVWRPLAGGDHARRPGGAWPCAPAQAGHPQSGARAAPAVALGGRAQRHLVLRHAQPHGPRHRPARPARGLRTAGGGFTVRSGATHRTSHAAHLHPLQRPRRFTGRCGRCDGRTAPCLAGQLPGVLQQL